jgi:hypothetical protein
MKYLKYFYLVIFAAIAIFWATKLFKKEPELRSTTQLTTHVSVKSKIFNNGMSQLNHIVAANFELVNVGKNPLIISDVKTDCNCTVPAWSRNKIQPNEKTLIKLIYDGRSLGYFQKKAIVSYNSENGPLILIIRGNVVDSATLAEKAVGIAN